MALNFLNNGYFAGKVGIGIADPQKPLDVLGNAKILGTLTVETANNNIRLLDSNDSTVTFSVGVNGRFQINDTTTGSNPFQIEKAAISDSIYIKANGNVGIGTNNPSTKLEVAVSANTNVDIAHFSNSNDVVKIKHALDGLGSGITSIFDSSNNEDIRLSAQSNSWFNAGNVGIGTDNPDRKLHVKDVNIVVSEFEGTNTGSLMDLVNSNSSQLYNGIRFTQGTTSRMAITHIADGTTKGYVQIGNSWATGSEILVVDGRTSNVGIGTTSPGGKLDITYAGTGGTGTFGIGEGLNITSFTPNITFNDTSSNVDNYAVHLNQNVFTLGRYTSATAQNPDLVLKSGNVGIGTTDPDNLLHIEGSITTAALQVNQTGAGVIANFKQGGNSKLLIDNSGNVGIGTTSPTAKLHVTGTGLFTGLVSGITPVAAANFVTKAYVDGSGGGTGPFLPLAGGTMTGDVRFNDGVEIEVGTSRDLVISHDGTNSYIKQIGTGDLIIRQSTDDRDIIFQSDNGSGGVATYFRLDGSLADGTYTYTSWGDNDKATFGDSQDLQIYHDGSHSYINDAATGALKILASQLEINNAANTENIATFTQNGAVSLYYDAVKKFETTTTGVTVTGTAKASAIEIEGTVPSILFDETDVTPNWRNRVQSGGYRVQYASDGTTFTDYFVLGAIANTVEKDTTFTGKVITTEVESASTLLLDATADITLDAGGSNINLKDDGTQFGRFTKSGDDFHITATRQDGDIKFFGNDGGSSITALRLDMSDSGWGHFNAGIVLGSISNATSDTDKFLVSDAGEVKYRTGAEVLSDIGAAPAVTGGYLPLAGGTMTGDLVVDGASITIDTDTAGNSLVWMESDSSTIAGQLRGYGNRGDIYLYASGVKKTEISSLNDSFIPALHIGGTAAASGGVLQVTGNASISATVTATTFSGDLNGTINTATLATTQLNPVDNDTVATTAYVNNKIGLIPAGLRFEGTWDASTGNPPSASPENGQFWIVSVAGSTNLSGITDWKVGDWAIYVVAGAGTDGWQKVDNSSVLDGFGTGGTITAWAGSGTSNTLTNSPITFSGNDVSFVGNGTFAGSVTTGTSLTVGTTALVNDTLYLAEYIQHIGNTSNNIRFTTDAISISANATFAGSINGGDINLSSTNNAIIDPLSVGNILRFTDNDPTQNNNQITGTIEWETKDSNNPGIQSFITTNSTNQGEGRLVFGTGLGGSAVERMRIDSDGIVGIGTISPVSTWLSGFDPSTGNGTFKLTSEGWIVTPYLTGLAGYYPGQGARPIVWADDSGTNLQCWDNSATDGVSLRSSNGTTRLFVREDGNVGIGTTTPDAKLDIADRVEIDTYAAQATGNNPFISGYLRIIAGAKTGWGVDDELGKIEFYGEDTSGVGARTAASIIAVCENGNGTSTTTFSSGLAFYTSPYNAAQEERIRVTADGNVGIGETNPSAKLDVNGSVKANTFVSIQGTDTGNPAAALDELRVSGYGIQGNRGSVYITNAGTTGNIRFGIGGTHASNNKMIIEAGGNVGIGTTGPQSKLQVAGGIQMADDTDTASATKVGTMRYRTGTEYVEVTGTELVANGDFATTATWTTSGTVAISGGTANWTNAVNGAGFFQAITFTANAFYRCVVTVSNYSTGTFRFRYPGISSPRVSANGTYSFIIQADQSQNATLYLQGEIGSDANVNFSIDNVSVIEVTAEDASYADMCMQTGASTYEWVNIVRNTY